MGLEALDEEELEARFKDAVGRARLHLSRPSKETMLKLYALYQQATVGDARGTPRQPSHYRPGDLAEWAKHEVWARLKGLPRRRARIVYVELVEQLLSEPRSKR